MVVSRDLECLQSSLNVLIGLLCWYGLVLNAAKYKAVTFHPDTLQSGMLEDAVGRRFTDSWVTYRKRLRIWIHFLE